MVVYADTSFLVALYGRDDNTPEARRVATGRRRPIVYTALHRHESRNAVRLALFRGQITADEAVAVLHAMEGDIQGGTLQAAPVLWDEVFTRAEGLSAAHTAGIGARAMDILHVAAAMALGIKEFLTFDVRQKALAAAAGLKVGP